MPYAYIREYNQDDRRNYYYHTDTAVNSSCTDESAESQYRGTTVIAWWDE